MGRILRAGRHLVPRKAGVLSSDAMAYGANVSIEIYTLGVRVMSTLVVILQVRAAGWVGIGVAVANFAPTFGKLSAIPGAWFHSGV